LNNAEKGREENKMILRRPRTTPLTWYKDIIENMIVTLRDYLGVLEEQISVLNKKQEEFVEEYEIDGQYFYYNSAEVPPEIVDSTWTNSIDKNSVLVSGGDFYSDYVPNIQRYSALITLYSFFEIQLIHLCNYLCNINERRIRLKDLNRRGGEIGRALLYLKKIEELEINRGSPTWNEITSIRKIRNKIVHDNGLLKGSSKEDDVRDYIEQHPEYFDSKGKKQLRITEKFLSHALEAFETFFLELQVSLEKKYKRHDLVI